MGEHDLSGPAEVDVREVELKAGGARLRALLAVPPSPCGWVIFAHEGGNSLHGSAHRGVARALNQAGLATLSMELLTAAEAVNRRKAFETPLLAERLMAGAEWLGMESGAGVGCFGAGEGAAAALWAASEKGSGIESLVACAPRLDLASDRLGEVRASTLLIVGGADRRALKQVRWARKRLGSSELIVVPGATRLFDAPAALRALADQSVEWFKRTVSSDAEVLETVHAGLSRETRRRLAAAASLLLLSGFFVGPKVVNAAVTSTWDSVTGMLRIAYASDGDQVSVSASGGTVNVVSNLGPVTITPSAPSPAAVLNIRIGADPSAATGEPGNNPAGAQLADVSAVSSANGFTGLAATGQPISIGAGAGNDTIIGSAFGDRVWARGDQDVVIGNAGNDNIDVHSGDDYVDGGAGNDTMDGSQGFDTLLGGADNDYLQDQAYTDNNAAVHDGGDGTDWFRAYVRTGSDNSATLVAGANDVTISQANADFNGVWTWSNIERLRLDGSNNAGASAGTNDVLDASLASLPVSIQGNDGSDLLIGNANNDTLNGEVGDDTIIGNAGNDIVDGSQGVNILYGGDGDDDVRDQFYLTGAYVHDGGAGTDQFRAYGRTSTTIGLSCTLLAGTGDVTIGTANGDFNGVWTYTGFESLRLHGSNVDTNAAGSGQDLIDATNSNVPAYLDGLGGNDSVIGGGLNDTLSGGDDNDVMTGNDGDDSLTGGAGDDVMNGNAGDDTLRSDRGWDTLDGGAGTGDLVNIGETDARQAIDTVAGQGVLISLLAATGPIAVRMAEVTNGTAGALATVPCANVEHYIITGNNYNDTALANTGDTLNGAADTAGITITGGGGKDIITGGSGNDSLTGGAEADIMNGNGGDDTLRSDRGWDTLDGGAGTLDQLNIGETDARQAIDTLTGQGVLISLVAAAGPVNVRLAEVNGGAPTTMGTNLEQFVFNGSNYNDTALANTGDTLDGAADSLGINISGNNGNDLITGGTGNDTLNGNAQNDTVTAGNGNDLINGGNENDLLNGGAGDDVYVFDQADTFRGSDTLADASGSDMADFSADTLSANSLLVHMGGSMDAVAGPSTVATADMIENVIGGPLDDLFIVTPSAATTQFADGGGGTANHLKYDGAATSGGVTNTPGADDTTPGTISGGGVQDVMYLNFAVVDTLVVSSARIWQVFE